MVDTTQDFKLYELDDDDKAHIRKLGFKERGLGYAKPNGYPATKADILKALGTPVPFGGPVADKWMFSTILRRGYEQSLIPGKTQEARDWFRKKAQDQRAGRMNKEKLFQDSFQTNQVRVGSMYMFTYDAKWKDELPYWDAFPVIFPIAHVDGGFHGINLHYLPYQLRAKLMDELYTIANNKRFDETTKLNISYGLLKTASNLSYFRPCYKHYLDNHVRSMFLYVEPSEWDIALFLPLQRWQKATQAEVWKDSRIIASGGKVSRKKKKA